MVQCSADSALYSYLKPRRPSIIMLLKDAEASSLLYDQQQG